MFCLVSGALFLCCNESDSVTAAVLQPCLFYQFLSRHFKLINLALVRENVHKFDPEMTHVSTTIFSNV